MSLEQQGRLIVIDATQQVNERFKKREFVIEISEDINGQTYTNYAKFQAVQNKCEVLDRFKLGDNVKVMFNIKGNKWERDGKVNYISNLDAWRIESVGSNTSNTPQGGNTNGGGTAYDNPSDPENGLPF